MDGLLWAWAYVLAKVVQSDSTVRRLPVSWAFASPPLVFYCIFLYLSGFVRCSKLTRQDLDAVNEMINKQPDLSIREIKERLHLNVCEETVRKAVIKLGYRVKKKSVHASEQERSRRESKAASLEGTQVKSSD